MFPVSYSSLLCATPAPAHSQGHLEFSITSDHFSLCLPSFSNAGQGNHRASHLNSQSAPLHLLDTRTCITENHLPLALLSSHHSALLTPHKGSRLAPKSYSASSSRRFQSSPSCIPASLDGQHPPRASNDHQISAAKAPPAAPLPCSTIPSCVAVCSHGVTSACS